jgi:hypothetical protein
MANRKRLLKKLKEETDKYSISIASIEKFYSDASNRKVSEKDFPHDQARIALENQKIIVELLDQIKKLEEE